MTKQSTTEILQKKFDDRHATACVQYFLEATEKYAAGDAEGVALKAGKFVEAVTKALMVFCQRQMPTNTRKFSAGNELRALEPLTTFPDTVRLVIPKASIFIYEVVNNRGGRHDSTEINANEMDARVVVPLMSWVLAEMVRFSSDLKTTDAAMSLIDGITAKTYPFFEDIDGRTYVNLEHAGAPDIALLLLYAAYPEGISRSDLMISIVRHGHKPDAAKKAVKRSMDLFDENEGVLKLRALGRQKAEQLIKKFQAKQINIK
jgi:hypothetical protein